MREGYLNRVSGLCRVSEHRRCGGDIPTDGCYLRDKAVVLRDSIKGTSNIYIYIYIYIEGRGGVVVKALRYKPQVSVSIPDGVIRIFH